MGKGQISEREESLREEEKVEDFNIEKDNVKQDEEEKSDRERCWWWSENLGCQGDVTIKQEMFAKLRQEDEKWRSNLEEAEAAIFLVEVMVEGEEV